jgi:hypothetical protein
MAQRARDFSRAHPSPDGNYTLVLDRLEKGIASIEALALQQEGGALASRAAVSRQRAVRREVHHEMLRHLVTVAQVAAGEQPGVDDLFRLPATSASNQAFQVHSRKLLEHGQAHRELLGRHGLADKLLDDLGAALDEFEASVVAANEGRRNHVGARAELDAVSDDVVKLVQMLDGLNRYRFGDDAELLAAWESARRVVSGPRPKESDTKPADGTGDVQSAA